MFSLFLSFSIFIRFPFFFFSPLLYWELYFQCLLYWYLFKIFKGKSQGEVGWGNVGNEAGKADNAPEKCDLN